MHPILTSHDFVVSGKAVKIINIPAEQCPVCEETRIFEIILGNARRYVHERKTEIVDYAACEEEESTNLLVTQMFF